MFHYSAFYNCFVSIHEQIFGFMVLESNHVQQSSSSVEINACSTLHNDSIEEFLISEGKTQILIAHQTEVVHGKKKFP